MCLNTVKFVMISANYHDITRLLLVTIIVSSKNCTISIIGKENITVNRQNRLITHHILNFFQSDVSSFTVDLIHSHVRT